MIFFLTPYFYFEFSILNSVDRQNVLELIDFVITVILLISLRVEADKG